MIDLIQSVTSILNSFAIAFLAIAVNRKRNK